jgi:hypothetical protein
MFDVRVDVIYSREFILHQNLAFLRHRDRQVSFKLQNFCPARLLDNHTRHGFGNGRHAAGEL